MEVTTEQVLITLDKLLENLGLQLEEYDFSFLTQAELYVEMFKSLFPSLVPMLDIDFSEEDINDEELIQSLIDFLSKYIIKVELDHISSKLIVNGDPKHILNFIQLLYEISKINMKGEGSEDQEGEGEGEGEVQSQQSLPIPKDKRVHSSPNSFKQLSESVRSSESDPKAIKYHTAQGIPEEFEIEEQGPPEVQVDDDGEEPSEEDIAATLKKQEINRILMKNENPYEYHPQKHESHESYNGSRISEVSKSKEFSDYEMNTKKKIARKSANPSTDNLEKQRHLEAKWSKKKQEEEEAQRLAEGEYEDGDHSESDQYISIHQEERHPQKIASHLHHGEEDEDDEQEVEYVDDYEYDPHNPTGSASRKGENSEDIQYYTSDPIDYRSISHKNREAQEQMEEDSKTGEQSEQVEEQEGYEYGDQYEEQYEEPESEDGQNAHEGEQMERKYDEEQQRIQYYEEERQKASAAERNTKARPQTAKSYKAGDVQFRPLRPVTGNIVRQPVEKKKKKTTKGKKGGQRKVQGAREATHSETQSERGQQGIRHSRSQRGEEEYRESQQNSEYQESQGGERYEGGNNRKSQNAYQRAFEDFAREQQIRQINRLKARQAAKRAVIKKVQIKPESLKNIYEVQQGLLYDKMRDEKLGYLRKIHKIIYQLDKQKIEEEKNAWINYRRSVEEDIINMVLTIKADAKQKIETLRRNHLSDLNERKMTDKTQKLFLKTLKQELNFDQIKDIQRLKNRWNNERNRFEMMTMDENFLEKKLVDLYKR